ncbi:MAG: RodZ domain-containing protein [Nitrolancea sp.]
MTSEFGELLRHARAYKGVTLREAERATRISRHYLVALEREEFDDLPALTYARGIVRRYAEYLGLDPVAVLAKFEDIHGQRSGGFRVVPAMKPLDVPSHWAPNFAIIAFMVVMSAVIFAWMYSAYFAPSDNLSTPTTSAISGVGTPSTAISTATATEVGTPSGLIAVGTATSTPVSSEASTPTPTEQTATEAPTSTPTTAPTPTPAPPPPTPTPENTTHTFAFSATHDVWIDATVDGKLVFSNVLAAGQSKSFTGQQMSLSSGDAEFVIVSVDGVSQGVLGTTWDASQTYPTSSQ